MQVALDPSGTRKFDGERLLELPNRYAAEAESDEPDDVVAAVVSLQPIVVEERDTSHVRSSW